MANNPRMPNDDLWDNPSPFVDGSPMTGRDTSDYGTLSPEGYYVPRPTIPEDNPDQAGAGAYSKGELAVSDQLRAGLDSLYADTLDIYSKDRPSAATPTARDLAVDEGVDEWTYPIGERR